MVKWDAAGWTVCQVRNTAGWRVSLWPSPSLALPLSYQVDSIWGWSDGECKGHRVGDQWEPELQPPILPVLTIVKLLEFTDIVSSHLMDFLGGLLILRNWQRVDFFFFLRQQLIELFHCLGKGNSVFCCKGEYKRSIWEVCSEMITAVATVLFPSGLIFLNWLYSSLFHILQTCSLGYLLRDGIFLGFSGWIHLPQIW